MKLNWDQTTTENVDSDNQDDHWPVRPAVLLIFTVSAVFGGVVAVAVIVLL